MNRPSLLLLASLCSCANVAGTEDLFICETCDSENDGGGGSDDDCPNGEVEVEFTIVGDVVIEIDSTKEVLTASTTRCLATGSEEFRASCAEDDSNADVTWGNAACPGATDQCEVSLSDDEEFTVDGTDACDD